MDAITNLVTRRSIRAYRPEPVDADTLKLVLEAAMFSPSAGDQEPWHFLVIQDPATLQAIAASHPFASFASQAPLAVLVCADIRDLPYPAFWPMEAAAATQTLMLAAHAQGLGSIWIGIHPRPDREDFIRQLIELPEGVMPFALVPLGKPAETPEQPIRWNEAKVHSEKWLKPWEPHRDFQPHHHYKPGDPELDSLA